MAVLILAVAGLGTGFLAVGADRAPAHVSKSCPPGYVDATLSWGEKCLHEGEFCKVGNPEYHQWGFDCPADGHLVDYGPASTTTSGVTSTAPTISPPLIGHTILVSRRTRVSGCRRGVLPDPRCSPGAYYSGLTRAVICGPTFRTGTIRNVPQSEKYAVEREYGMPAQLYGRTIEIDHIVSLELGGSNDVANLFPEPGSGRASYHVKDVLENRLHDMACAGEMTLASVRRGIATNWETLYARVFGTPPA